MTRRARLAAFSAMLVVGPLAHAGPFAFRDATKESGLGGVVMRDGAWFGTAVAFVDLDGDLWPDLYFGGGQKQRDQLCINTHDGKFACAARGPARTDVALAITAGDYDNDGDLDLYVLTGGRNTLLENDGRGGLTDVTDEHGAAGNGSVGPTGTFLDYDGDGRLDLYVGRGDSGIDGYTEVPQLLRQGADGKFTDVAGAAGLALPKNTLAMIAFDYDGDMRQDLFVTGNFNLATLFHNDGNGTFSNVTAEQPMAFQTALVEGMGVDIADFDGDGDFDIYASNSVANLQNPGSGFFVNQGDGTFTSNAAEYDVLGAFGWGTGWVDFDDDTWPDILVVGNTADHHFLYRNVLGKRFETQLLPRAPGGAALDCVTAVFADYDRDGKVDVLLARLNGMGVELLHNETPTTGHFVNIHLAGAAQRTLGALVEVKAGDRVLRRQRLSQTSKGAQNESGLHFGLGDATTIDIDVRWPDGGADHLTGVPVDGNVSIEEGCASMGSAWPAACNKLVTEAASRGPNLGVVDEGCTVAVGRAHGDGLVPLLLVLAWYAQQRRRRASV